MELARIEQRDEAYWRNLGNRRRDSVRVCVDPSERGRMQRVALGGVLPGSHGLGRGGLPGGRSRSCGALRTLAEDGPARCRAQRSRHRRRGDTGGCRVGRGRAGPGRLHAASIRAGLGGRSTRTGRDRGAAGRGRGSERPEQQRLVAPSHGCRRGLGCAHRGGAGRRGRPRGCEDWHDASRQRRGGRRCTSRSCEGPGRRQSKPC